VSLIVQMARTTWYDPAVWLGNVQVWVTPLMGGCAPRGVMDTVQNGVVVSKEARVNGTVAFHPALVI
jgi:hypothetical protein